MHALLVNDTSDSYNIGGRANALALKMMLRDAGVHKISSVHSNDISPYIDINRNRLLLKHYLSLFVPPVIPKVKVKFFGEGRSNSEYDYKIPAKWSEFDTLSEYYLKEKKFQGFIDLVDSVDVVVINGEGTIYGDRDESLFILFIAYLAKKYMKKPVIVVNHTLDASGGEIRKVVDNLYPLLDDIVFREYFSIEKFGHFHKARFAADTAFAYKAIRQKKLADISGRPGYYDVWPYQTYDFNPNKPYVCISGSSIFYRKDMRFIDPTADFVELCKALQKKFDQVICISSDKPDDRFLTKVASSLKLPFLSCRTSLLQVLDVIGNARVFISGRWHPSIFAVNNGVPIVAFAAHNFKMKALMELMDIDDKVYSADNLADLKDEIIKRTAYYYDNSEIREHLLSKSVAMEKSSYENVSFVKDLKLGK